VVLRDGLALREGAEPIQTVPHDQERQAAFFVTLPAALEII